MQNLEFQTGLLQTHCNLDCLKLQLSVHLVLPNQKQQIMTNY